MSTDHVELAPDAPGPTMEPEPYSADWWQARTTAELRDIITHGFRHGPPYEMAVAETERRAREAVRRAREAQDAAERKSGKVRLMVLAAVLAAVVAIGFLDWLVVPRV